MPKERRDKSCHSDQYLAQIQIAAATNSATERGARKSDGAFAACIFVVV
jgi:hypothetical protein